MPKHSEEFNIKRVFQSFTELVNVHHTRGAFFYYDAHLRKYVVHAGRRTKNRLEYLLENDAKLKKGLRKDSDDSNRCNDTQFLEDDINQVRGRVPIARLEQKVQYLNLSELAKYLRIEVFNDYVAAAAAAGKKSKTRISYGKKEFKPWWWKHVAHLLRWSRVHKSFDQFSIEEFNAIKGPGVTNMTECLKEIIRIFHRVNNIDPDSHVIQDYSKKTLNDKKRRRGEKLIPSDSSTSGSSTSGSSTSGSSTSGSSSSASLSSYFSSQPTRPLGRSRSQIHAAVQQLLGGGRSHAALSSSQPPTSVPPPAPAASPATSHAASSSPQTPLPSSQPPTSTS